MYIQLVLKEDQSMFISARKYICKVAYLCIYFGILHENVHISIHLLHLQKSSSKIVTQNVKVLSSKFNLMIYLYMGSFDEKSPFILVFDK